MSRRQKKVSTIQAGSDPFNSAEAIDKFGDLLVDAKSRGSELAVFPEAFIGGYPKGIDFGTRVGSRTEDGRELFRLYSDNAIVLGDASYEKISEAVAANGMAVVVGVIERRGGTLNCTALGFEKDGSLLGAHRKLVPTAMERIIWGRGDGGDLPIMDSSAGRLVSAICWENYMPHLRAFYYDHQPDFYCAPTVDDRKVWVPSMQHIAIEGRCFVLSACQYQTRGMISLSPEQYEAREGDDPDTVLINGGSCIVDPMGGILAGPVYGEETILTAEVDMDLLTRAKFDRDVAGHYARPDVFELKANVTPQKNVREA